PRSPHSSPLSLHDALPIFFRSAPNVHGAIEIGPSTTHSLQLGSYESGSTNIVSVVNQTTPYGGLIRGALQGHLVLALRDGNTTRSEEHTSELQSRENLVCR